MKVRLYRDDTTTLSLDAIAGNLNRLAPSFSFSVGKAKFAIPGFFVVSPDTYGSLNPRIDKESALDDEVILFTEKPYDNNYFWESEGNKVILSLFAWDQLTSLPRNNVAAASSSAEGARSQQETLTRARGLEIHESHRTRQSRSLSDACLHGHFGRRDLPDLCLG